MGINERNCVACPLARELLKEEDAICFVPGVCRGSENHVFVWKPANLESLCTFRKKKKAEIVSVLSTQLSKEFLAQKPSGVCLCSSGLNPRPAFPRHFPLEMLLAMCGALVT